jgi:lysophospholipid acyltransferase (LPLAT)-like uncharacterized protein
MVARLWARSLRVEFEDVGNLFGSGDRPPVIFAFWHNRLFLMPYFYRRYQPKGKAVALASRSRDGQWLVDILKQFKIEAARGSSSRAGSGAVRVVARLMQREHYDVAITPDGPRGPRYSLQPGVLYLSQLTGYAIGPLRLEYESNWALRSWDAFQLPKPGSKARIIFDQPMVVPKNLTPEEFEQWRLKISAKLSG